MEITVTASLVIAALSLAYTFYRETTKKHNTTGKDQAIIEAKLNSIQEDLMEIKSELKDIRSDWMKDHEVLLGLQREVAAMWKIVDKLNGKESNEKPKN